VIVSTKKGDGGYTGLPAGRVPKNDPRIECLGDVDELDAFLAAVLLASPTRRSAETVNAVRDELSTAILPALAGISSCPANIDYLETRITELETRIRRNNTFVRTWTRPASASLNIARTICRRAERRAVTLARIGESGAAAGNRSDDDKGAENKGTEGKETAGWETENDMVTVYLNRLSDLLFLLAVNEETA
jgi:cob(I)alamin adenosyltransferase